MPASTPPGAMPRQESYPQQAIRKDASRPREVKAIVAAVEPGSPADDAGFYAGCALTALNGQPITDILDWRWRSDDFEITVGYIDGDGDCGEVVLQREEGEGWGFEFDGVIFDGVRRCRNRCTFCFMEQLPAGMRPSLYLRDDDFRLSFLSGTFVTLTNLTPQDEARIIEQRLSPLHVSLQVVDADLRATLMGKSAPRGLEALERLLAAGIECHAQVVLVPGLNDGEALTSTLTWAYERPGILSVGVVPLGFTDHQERFAASYNEPAQAQEVLRLLEPFQRRAEAERGNSWVFAADEFYRNAYPQDLLDHLPKTAFYGDFALFEDGIGIVRSFVDDWHRAEGLGLIDRCAQALKRASRKVYLVAGCAQREFLDALVARSGLGDCFSPFYVENRFFGGNVDVTGLLTGQDILAALESLPKDASVSVCLPSVIFNDDGLTLDDHTAASLEIAAGRPLPVVSLSPLDYFPEMEALAAKAG